MRQVPQISNYLLVGSGKMARHMSRYLDLLSLPYSTWNRNDNSTADLIQKLKFHSITLLCISDDQIGSFIEEFKDQGHQFVHFSGALEIEGVIGVHPMMSFGHELYDLDTYSSIHMVGTSEKSEFDRLFPHFKNSYSQIKTEHKALYHSLCVLGGNGTTLIWDLVQKELQKIGVPSEATSPYLMRVCKNIAEDQLGRWTGPWYRQDQGTIKKNKQALSENKLADLYEDLENLSKHSGFEDEKRSRI